MGLLYEENLFGNNNDYIALYLDSKVGHIIVTDFKQHMIKQSMNIYEFYNQYKNIFEHDFIVKIIEEVCNE